MKRNFMLMASLILAGTMSLSAADINLAAGADIRAAVETAGEGDVIILADGTYEDATGGENAINLTKSITIKAADPGKASLVKYSFMVPANGNIADLEFDGINASHDLTMDSRYFLQVNTATSAVTNLTIKNCVISDFSRGVVRATQDNATKITNLLIENCIFEGNSTGNAGYANINTQKCTSESIIIRNCTFYHSPAALFRYEATNNLNLLIENCTVLNLGSGSGRKMIEIGSGTHSDSPLSVKDCIFSGSFDTTVPDGTSHSIDLYNLGTVENCILEGYSTVLTNRSGNPESVGSVTSFDFESFTIATDPATISGIGDPRWILNGQVNGISVPDAEKVVKSVEYYDILGKQITGEVKGLVIEKVVYEDGSIATAKVLK
ncbi:MAG: DUF4957 domain-containing protein [Candidatus Azobacteroides sp.]|nr:DUF4957 domain-containing protein [Candidatus Azobacteroides sp.]